MTKIEPSDVFVIKEILKDADSIETDWNVPDVVRSLVLSWIHAEARARMHAFKNIPTCTLKQHMFGSPESNGHDCPLGWEYFKWLAAVKKEVGWGEETT